MTFDSAEKFREEKIDRRNFVRLLGAGAAAAMFGVAFNSPLTKATQPVTIVCTENGCFVKGELPEDSGGRAIACGDTCESIILPPNSSGPLAFGSCCGVTVRNRTSCTRQITCCDFNPGSACAPVCETSSCL